MKPTINLFITLMFLVFFAFSPAMAGSMGHSMNHHHEMREDAHDMAPSSGMHGMHDMNDMDQSSHEMDMHGMDEGHRMGENIRTATVDGYKFSYHLIDMREKMAAMKGMDHMSVTHHLMVYVTGPDGKTLRAGKAGYLVEGPDGAKQKLICMGMGGGYGSDVNFSAKGKYTVKSKLKVGDHALRDTFTYDVQ